MQYYKMRFFNVHLKLNVENAHSTIKDEFEFRVIFIHQILIGLMPPYLTKCINLNSDIHNYGTRYKNNVYTNCINKSLLKNSVS